MLHKKNLNKFVATILISISSFVCADEIFIHKPFVFTPSALGAVTVSHDDSDFYVWQDGERHQVEYYDLDPMLRNPSKEKLQNFFSRNYIAVSRCDNGDFIIRAKVRTKGGGAVLALAFYWGTKAVCYGTAAAAVGAGAAAATPVLVGAATAVAGASGGAVVGGAGTWAASTLAGTTATAMATPGAALVAGAISTSAALTAEATVVTVSTVATAGGVAGAVAMVESAATGMAAIGMMIPFL